MLRHLTGITFLDNSSIPSTLLFSNSNSSIRDRQREVMSTSTTINLMRGLTAVEITVLNSNNTKLLYWNSMTLRHLSLRNLKRRVNNLILFLLEIQTSLKAPNLKSNNINLRINQFNNYWLNRIRELANLEEDIMRLGSIIILGTKMLDRRPKL